MTSQITNTSRKGKRYTEKELEKIKELYAKDYSASLILEKIGRAVAHSSEAGTWLFNMQKRLNLPKRGTGFQGIRNKFVNKERCIERLKVKLQKAKERKTKIHEIINDLDKHKEQLQKELQQTPLIIKDYETKIKRLEAHNV